MAVICLFPHTLPATFLTPHPNDTPQLLCEGSRPVALPPPPCYCRGVTCARPSSSKHCRLGGAGALGSFCSLFAAHVRPLSARICSCSLSNSAASCSLSQKGDLHLLIVDLATRKNPFLQLVAHAHHCDHGGIWAERELDGAEKLPHDQERLLGDLRRSDGVELFGDDARLRIFDTGRGGADANWLERRATAIAVEFVENGASEEGRTRRHGQT